MSGLYGVQNLAVFFVIAGLMGFGSVVTVVAQNLMGLPTKER